ncbi:YbcC family protein [Stieleria varia]|uniref:Probable inorganic carbon transporter subunit DabA n=1 Tax=Stieleria varia TaxID=2528005 RepID=A0A5C6AWY6_9BACT|nr:DUF2309 domain-containing protein [Stieleria varia]TWU04453.1 hypothetical protein Pla52n_24940 [Stieleria varia]
MSIAQPAEFHVADAPVFVTPRIVRKIDDVLSKVAGVVSPVWPLRDYVAVNPYAGLSAQSFLAARESMRSYSDCELLMPLKHYAAEFHKGNFSVADIRVAIGEVAAAGVVSQYTAEELADQLNTIGPCGVHFDDSLSPTNGDRVVRTIAELATKTGCADWQEVIIDDISKHCAAYYDQGQAKWSRPNLGQSLYESWRDSAQDDLNVEILGLSGFRQFVRGLPSTPQEAIGAMLQALAIPESLWSRFLLCQAFSVPGWSAWTKYQSSWAGGGDGEGPDFNSLLAIRMAYDVALAKLQDVCVDWVDLFDGVSPEHFPAGDASQDDIDVRYTLLQASEIGYRNRLLNSLVMNEEASRNTDTDRKLAQMVFCIDVRSERIRRQLETVSDKVETFGFAGFFGMPIEYVPLGAKSGVPHLPVLLKPKFKLREGLHETDTPIETQAIADRHRIRSWKQMWKGFQTSAVGCFTFVETTGLMYGLKLLRRALGLSGQQGDARFDGVAVQDREHIGPTLRGLNQQGITTSVQADLAEAMLRNLGLTENFAKLVVFCGHGSQTDNNPLAAGLDCGACGGHSGQPNARFAAMLLNQPYIRSVLSDRGIDIPEDTWFVAGLHNTTTDSITFYDQAEVPSHRALEIGCLTDICDTASEQTRLERMPVVASSSVSDLLKRASDWSEVRPEWGLAGNAAFVVAPRSVTQHANLDARSFLHSYDHRQDPHGSVLEAIMTAPMVVAHWINMQYYASTVDNRYFGSGNKTVHNVVGQFGILSGNGGDLMTGLPWQSLHTGSDFQHLPQRLLVVIAAPRESIGRVIAKHQPVADLLHGGWLHLMSIEDGKVYRYTMDGVWESTSSKKKDTHSI